MLGTQYGYFASISASNAPTATILEYLMPILIIFWYCLTERRWPRRREIFCTIFAVAGTALIATGGSFRSLAISEKPSSGASSPPWPAPSTPWRR